ncbi:MAG: SAM-dependent methyltransferase, partial [Candidatus Latescibacterota bacterium]
MPIFARLAGRPVLVVGGGAVARRKVALLQRAGARVIVNAPELCPELEAVARQADLRVVRTEFAPELVGEVFLVVAATDEPATNARVFAAGERLGRLVNSVDDPEHCSFITPAIVDRSPLIVAISSGAAAPALARRLRTWLEARLPEAMGALFALAQRCRAPIVARFPDPRQRRRFYDWLVDRSSVPAALDQGRPDLAEARLQQILAEPETRVLAGGRVVLAGAGPGDPGLLTLRTLRHLECADTILYDRLVSPEILERARRDAVLVPVEKEPGGAGWSQAAILSELAARAAAGEYVVRLKGGDPFVFGRGGEEAEHLRRLGVPVEVVPGITAALGCAAA